jgi:hypothetical protein
MKKRRWYISKSIKSSSVISTALLLITVRLTLIAILKSILHSQRNISSHFVCKISEAIHVVTIRFIEQITYTQTKGEIFVRIRSIHTPQTVPEGGAKKSLLASTRVWRATNKLVKLT